MAAVAHHVDHDIFVEGLPVVEGQFCHTRARFGIVAVHVKDRRLDHAGDIGRIHRRACRIWRGGETHLIVNDDVHTATDAITLDLREVQRLGHHTLAGERRVAMDQDR